MINVSSPFDLTGLRGQLRADIKLSQYTTWRVGGCADWFYEPADVADVLAFLPRVPADMPILWLGLGSNLLVRDGGVRGVIILTSGLLNEITWVNEKSLRVEAGVSCAKVARLTAKEKLKNAEFLAGIPGTVGGALRMNAGAWGGETWRIITHVETVNRQGIVKQQEKQAFEVGYRHVQLAQDEWFLSATLQLEENPLGDGLDKIRDLLRERGEKQPLGLPSCGSVFRNPPQDFAARLIEQAGWKGKGIGDAYVSEKHANFIINRKAARAQDIEQLIEQIRESVAEKFGVWLIPEVKVIGESL